MPYIGKNPVGGGFHKLDALTASATDTYALTLGSAAYYPESANQLLVSLNGVIQAPQDSFTVSGSNLVFDTALTASDSIDFVVALGDVLAVQTVTDGAITTNKLGNGAVTSAKLASTIAPTNLETTSSTFKMTDLTSNAFYRTGTFTPTFTNFTVGNGSVYGRYIRIGDIVTCWFGFEFGSTSSVGGGLTAVTGLPFTSVELVSGASNGYFPVDGIIWNNGTGWHSVHAKMNENNTNVIYVQRRTDDSDVNATNPITWASGDTLNLTVTYETDDA